MVLVEDYDNTICNGILVTNRIIIAPARCTSNNNVTVTFLTKTNFPKVKDKVRYIFNSSVNEVLYSVSHVIKHPEYNSTLDTYDIALLKLKKKYDNAVPACLWIDNNIPAKPIIVKWYYPHRRIFKDELEITILDNFNCMRYKQPFDSRADLAEYQFCVVSEEYYLELPLYTDMIYDDSIIPYVIGFRSFRLEGLYKFNVYVKISYFVEWIKESIQELGEKIPSSLLDPLACARENLEHRRKINGSLPLVKNKTVKYMVEILVNPETDQNSNCAGALIKEDIVVTLAQCAENLISFSSRVVMSDSSNITIRDVFLHPNYTEDSLYNNIALLKLSEKCAVKLLSFPESYQIEHNKEVFLFGKQRYTNSNLQGFNDLAVKAQGISIIFNHKCNPTEEQSLRLFKGLQYEHLCLQNDHFLLVPGSCEAIPGSPVVISGINRSPGLYMFGRNCGFGEPVIMVLFLAHEKWMNSIIEAPASGSAVFIIPNLGLSDDCTYPDGAKGTCVSQTTCPQINKRVQNSLPIFFCKVRSIVCCLQHNIEDEFTFAINRS
ncbi:uncharacterized protein LOC125767006 isoform X2 [Anopheles funestus]|nr:uncharacterized protein LOC125767006 isoform X2 [Anopheles funestus]